MAVNLSVTEDRKWWQELCFWLQSECPALVTLDDIKDLVIFAGKDIEFDKIAQDLVDSSPIAFYQKVYNTLELFHQLKDYLNQGEIVHFQFIKKDGTMRDAYGTRNPEIIKQYEEKKDPNSKSRSRSKPTGVFSYFDIEKKGWRCFSYESLVFFDSSYTL